jgi:hypothetical protein
MNKMIEIPFNKKLAIVVVDLVIEVLCNKFNL